MVDILRLTMKATVFSIDNSAAEWNIDILLQQIFKVTRDKSRVIAKVYKI